MLLVRAEKWLNELEIRTERGNNFLKVDRDDATAFGDLSDLLFELKTGLTNPRLCWSGKDDNWIFLESY